MIHALAVLDVNFKKCCMKSKKYDGIHRDYYF